jgi:hypothetical protein
MLKDVAYKDKFKMLDPWLQSIVESVKKDLKNEHLKQDWQFAKKYFANKNIAKLTAEELTEGYRLALANEEAAEALAEFISNRWLLKHTELYHYFEEQLQQINPNFNELEELERNQAHNLMEKAVSLFGAPKTYMFSIINSVVFPKEIFDKLGQNAQNASREETENAKAMEEKMSVDMIHQSYQQQIARLTDKYEKKLLGMQKKYIQDVETLKKQLSTLQRKVHQQ